MASRACILLLLVQATVYYGGLLCLGARQSSVVEHPVIWSLSGLDKKNESLILDALLNLRSAPEVISLSTGRLVKKVDNRYNYALFARFPSFEALKNYYNVRLDRVIPLMIPFIQEEYTVDYQAYIDPFLSAKVENANVHITLMNVKNGTRENVVQAALTSIKSLAHKMPSLILQITAGRNNFDRDTTFSHAFVAHVTPDKGSLKKFYSDPSYKLVEKKLRHICDKMISVDYRVPKPRPGTE